MKTFVRKIAEHKEWDAPLYALAILTSVLVVGLDYPFDRQKHSGFSLMLTLAAVVFSVAIVLQVIEARRVRYWTDLADKIKSGADDQIVLKSWRNIYSVAFMTTMGILPYTEMNHQHHSLRWFAWIFVFFGVWVFLTRTRWSPIGIPEIEVTKDHIRIPNPLSLQVDGKKEKRRSYLTGVLFIPLDQVKSVYWGVVGRNVRLIVKCSGLIVEHPFLRRPPETIVDHECLIAADLAGGTIPVDAIVSFVEQIAPNYEGK